MKKMADLEAKFVNHRALAAREPVRAITQVMQQFIYDALGQAMGFEVDEVDDRRYQKVMGAASAGARSVSGKTLIMILDLAFALSQGGMVAEAPPQEVSGLEVLDLPDELQKALARRDVNSLADLFRPLESPLTERQQEMLESKILATMRSSEGASEED